MSSESKALDVIAKLVDTNNAHNERSMDTIKTMTKAFMTALGQMSFAPSDKVKVKFEPAQEPAKPVKSSKPAAAAPSRPSRKRPLPELEGTPIYGEPRRFSRKTVEKINEHVNDYNVGRSEEHQVKPFDPENTNIVVLPINEERTWFAMFTLIDPTKPPSEKNCRPAFEGFTIRCHVDHKEGVDHSSAGAIAKIHADPASAKKHFLEQVKDGETNGCIIGKDEVISYEPEDESSAAAPVKVKTEKTEKTKKAKTTYKDGFAREDATKDRKWTLWKTAFEVTGDGKPAGKEVYFFFEKTKDEVFLAIGCASATYKPPSSLFPTAECRKTDVVQKYKTLDGEEKTGTIRTFLFAASLVPKISKSFKYDSDGLLYDGSVPDSVFKQ